MGCPVQVLTTSKAVKDERVAVGMTQQALATKADIALRTLARIEAGEDCNISTLARIAVALDIPLLRLVGPDAPCPHPSCTNDRRTTWHHSDPCPYASEPESAA